LAGRASSTASIRIAIAILVLGALTGTGAIAAYGLREAGIGVHERSPLATHVSFAPRVGEQPAGAGGLPDVSAPPPDAAELTRLAGALRAGEDLAASLERREVPEGVRASVVRELAPFLGTQGAEAGHRWRLAMAPDGRLTDFRYDLSDVDSFRMRPASGGEGFRVWPETATSERRVARVAGVVTSSLYDAMTDLGESSQLAGDFADIFAWDVDFSRTARAGDEFRVLYERRYRVGEDGQEEYLGPGRILSARYRGEVGDYAVVYYEPEEGEPGYYRPDGSSIERQFLQAPLRYTRISSRFNPARKHPILKIVRPHHGIDYAAPDGTPIWSVAEGRVIYKGWAGGSGKLVKVRHPKGYVSYYAHLSSYADGLEVGDTVAQKQVIGTVGATGLATGPHVCFRIKQNGRYVNPTEVHTPAGAPVPLAEQHKFRAARDVLLAELAAGPLLATDEPG